MMENVTSREPHNEWTTAEITMAAAGSFVTELFADADDDTKYHHCPAEVRDALEHGNCTHTPEEIAEQILAWSGAL